MNISIVTISPINHQKRKVNPLWDKGHNSRKKFNKLVHLNSNKNLIYESSFALTLHLRIVCIHIHDWFKSEKIWLNIQLLSYLLLEFWSLYENTGTPVNKMYRQIEILSKLMFNVEGKLIPIRTSQNVLIAMGSNTFKNFPHYLLLFC